jgi:hypothetical protein
VNTFLLKLYRPGRLENGDCGGRVASRWPQFLHDPRPTSQTTVAFVNGPWRARQSVIGVGAEIQCQHPLRSPAAHQPRAASVRCKSLSTSSSRCSARPPRVLALLWLRSKVRGGSAAVQVGGHQRQAALQLAEVVAAAGCGKHAGQLRLQCGAAEQAGGQGATQAFQRTQQRAA